MAMRLLGIRKSQSSIGRGHQFLLSPGKSFLTYLVHHLRDSDNSTGNKPDLVLSTGSELQIAAKAAIELRKEGKTVSVVSLVSWELFQEQSDECKDQQ